MQDIIQTQGVIYVKNVMIIVKHVKMEQQIINVLPVIIIKFFYKLKYAPIIAIINNLRIKIKIVSNVILRVLLARILIRVILVKKDHIQKEVHKNANYVTQIVKHLQKRANVYLVNKIFFQPKINNVNQNVINLFFQILKEIVNHVILIVQNLIRDSIYLMDFVVMKFIAKRILTQTKMSAKQNVLKINLKMQRLIHAILAIPSAKDARKEALLNAWSAKMNLF
ncbi:hypothetical protein IMG5_088850 [Ichthyophthirius multifiliis]|uniref:Uncharacterized protein n=1 Tax=Ichthyophthirius multifiliis TaxID=5932 RepID=G0QR49_ICHMU|nr:hypothetical protein IMG5_088850 [Ichthyophthirius multifiliis]EGR32301.1 hypothetical protein IMG5_088850 [Ichthyophthirius multifiliis]|eukprot:XP_004035787.1 hypothetical protein IMG5_088850 [Ichthyophthirius multifiliis]